MPSSARAINGIDNELRRSDEELPALIALFFDLEHPWPSALSKCTLRGRNPCVGYFALPTRIKHRDGVFRYSKQTHQTYVMEISMIQYPARIVFELQRRLTIENEDALELEYFSRLVPVPVIPPEEET